MICQQCGKEFEKENKVCPHCGYLNLSEIPSELDHMSENQLHKRLKRVKWVEKHQYVLIGLVILLFIGGGVFYYFRETKQVAQIPNFHDDLIENTSSNASGNSISNLVNKGILLQYGDTMYSSGQEGISCVSLSLDKKNVVLNQKAICLNAANNGFYYINQDDGFIYHFDTTKQTPTKLNIQAKKIVVVGDYLYYLEEKDEHAIYRMNIQTSETKKMTQSQCNQFEIIGNWIYFTTDKAFYQTPLLGGEIMKVADVYYSRFTLEENTIYYIDSTTGYLNRIQKDGTSPISVVKQKVQSFILTERYIFYSKVDGGLYKQNRETGEVSLISNETAYDIQIAGTWIYYLNDVGAGCFVSVDENSDTVTAINNINDQ